MESYLLTEEFQEFSAKIKKLYEEKSGKKAAMKKLYDQYLADIEKLDAQAAEEEAKLESWRKSAYEINKTGPAGQVDATSIKVASVDEAFKEL
jgi:hypothetical protein